MLLINRKLPQSKVMAIENDLRGTLRNFDLKASVVGTVKFEGESRSWIAKTSPTWSSLIEPLLIAGS
jgi:hypothetical protein